MAQILIVDDDKDTRDSLAVCLRSAKHFVTCAPNGRDALAHVLNQMPDVILLDLLMPDMDGATFLEVVRSYMRFQSLPVVVLTGAGDNPIIDRARALRVNSILIKGKASFDDIVGAIKQSVVRYPN